MKRFMPILFVVGLMALVLSQALALTDTAVQSFTITVDEIAEIDVTGVPGNFVLSAPAAGAPPTIAPDPDATTYAQYTSTVVATQARTITAASAHSGAGVITNVLGLNLNLTATAPPSTGTVGIASGGQDFAGCVGAGGTIMTQIGSCFTGTGGTDGALLTYTLTITDIANVFVTIPAVGLNVTLTLTEDV